MFLWPAADFSSRRFANLTEDLREIKAGKEHLLALTANGQVFIPAAFVVFARSSKLAGLLHPSLRTPVNNIEYFPPNFEGLVLGCIDADFCK